MRRAVLLLSLALFLSVAVAQESSATTRQTTVTPPTNLDVKIGVLESRVNRLEIDVGDLRGLPQAIARIESRLIALDEKASGSADVISSLGLGLAMALLGGGIGVLIGRKRPSE